MLFASLVHDSHLWNLYIHLLRNTLQALTQGETHRLHKVRWSDSLIAMTIPVALRE